MYQQEAHDTEVWPIALPGALPPTLNVIDRAKNAKIFLERYPGMKIGMNWFLDIPQVVETQPGEPERRNANHIGGGFQNLVNSWPHRYFVFRRNELIWRSEYRWSKEGKIIEFSDLVKFLESLVV